MIDIPPIDPERLRTSLREMETWLWDDGPFHWAVVLLAARAHLYHLTGERPYVQDGAALEPKL